MSSNIPRCTFSIRLHDVIQRVSTVLLNYARLDSDLSAATLPQCQRKKNVHTSIQITTVRRNPYRTELTEWPHWTRGPESTSVPLICNLDREVAAIVHRQLSFPTSLFLCANPIAISPSSSESTKKKKIGPQVHGSSRLSIS